MVETEDQEQESSIEAMLPGAGYSWIKGRLVVAISECDRPVPNPGLEPPCWLPVTRQWKGRALTTTGGTEETTPQRYGQLWFR